MEDSEALTRKLQELLSDWDNDAAQFCFKEEAIEEVMQELYKEIIASSPLPKPPSPTPTPTPEAELAVSEVKKDEVDFDDEWLTRVLTWGQNQPQLLDTTHWF